MDPNTFPTKNDNDDWNPTNKFAPYISANVTSAKKIAFFPANFPKATA